MQVRANLRKKHQLPKPREYGNENLEGKENINYPQRQCEES